MREFNYSDLTVNVNSVEDSVFIETAPSHMDEDERFYELLKDIKAACSAEKDDFSSLFIYL